MPTVTITRRGEERVRNGHPWVYRSDVVQASASSGETVRVVGPRGKPIGFALYSDRSEIALRVFSRSSEPPTVATWRERVMSAISYRSRLGIDATAYRLVHGEADRLPGLVVDKYADYQLCLVDEATNVTVGAGMITGEGT